MGNKFNVEKVRELIKQVISLNNVEFDFFLELFDNEVNKTGFKLTLEKLE